MIVKIRAFETTNDRVHQNLKKSQELESAVGCKDFYDKTNKGVSQGKALAYYTEDGRELRSFEEAWQYLGGSIDFGDLELEGPIYYAENGKEIHFA